MHPPIELHRHRGKTPNNGQSLTISYTSLYIILDMYLYSKAPPGVNDVITENVSLARSFKNHSASCIV